ncbi:hypothetical protein [Halomonas sp. HL-93]|uniref:hypothetical protein n=1 Tax=Halomonas sp. HL-93 TaxID=1666906 RepID=UPI0007F171EA|nr:hypothetical protein [Halomonas sp. HL-93]SBR50224.1 hypothetical protein GA0071314_2574 [Halomonas sp. HL-93]
MHWILNNTFRFISLPLLLCSATTAFSQESASAADVLDIEEIERIADIARAGSDPRITASLADQSGRDENRTTATPPVLVSIQGDPAFVYTRGANYDVPEGEPEFVMRCRGDGIIDLTSVVSQLMDDPLELNPDDEYSLNIRPYGQTLEFSMPVALGERFSSDRHVVRVSGSARADASFFTRLKGTTNFAYQLKRNGAFLPMSGGLDFSTFRADVGPLLEYCRAGKPNPLESIDLDEIVIAENNSRPDEAPTEIDLSFLDQSQARTFQRIYEGRRSPLESSLRPRMLNYLAFHLAYGEGCASATDEPMFSYKTTPLTEVQTVSILEDDFAPFVLTASTYEDVSREIYDSELRNDFSFSVLSQRFDELLQRQQEGFMRVFTHHGCSGVVFDRLRQNIREDLPWYDYSDGGRDVVVDFGGRQFDLWLSQPIDIALARNPDGAPTPEPALTPERPAPAVDSRAPSLAGPFTPNAQDIQNAIQANVDVAFQRLDAMGDQCNTYRRDNNPVAAMMCLFSGGGAMNSSTGNMRITSVSLDHCVRMEDPDVSAYCRYRADMSMTGSGMLGQVASLVNAASAFNQWTWASFRQDGQTWQLVESWDNCRVDDNLLRCTSRR